MIPRRVAAARAAGVKIAAAAHATANGMTQWYCDPSATMCSAYPLARPS